jgi:hypothetical protein
VCAQVKNRRPKSHLKQRARSSSHQLHPKPCPSCLQLRRARSCCDDARNSEQRTHSKRHRMALAVVAARRAATLTDPVSLAWAKKCADTRRVTFGSPSVRSLRCTGRTAWPYRRRKQAGHTLLDDVFPIFMALVELLGEVPADIQARGTSAKCFLHTRRDGCRSTCYHAHVHRDQLGPPLGFTGPCHSTDVANSQSFASGAFFHPERCQAPFGGCRCVVR